jgi:hypothetical protein
MEGVYIFLIYRCAALLRVREKMEGVYVMQMDLEPKQTENVFDFAFLDGM